MSRRDPTPTTTLPSSAPTLPRVLGGTPYVHVTRVESGPILWHAGTDRGSDHFSNFTE